MKFCSAQGAAHPDPSQRGINQSFQMVLDAVITPPIFSCAGPRLPHRVREPTFPTRPPRQIPQLWPKIRSDQDILVACPQGGSGRTLCPERGRHYLVNTNTVSVAQMAIKLSFIQIFKVPLSTALAPLFVYCTYKTNYFVYMILFSSYV